MSTSSASAGESKASAKPTASKANESPPVHAGGSGGSAPFRTPAGDNSIPNYGAEASKSQQAEATAALRTYLEARESGDWSTACATMGATVQSQVEVLAKVSKPAIKGCEEAYATVSAYEPTKERTNPLVGGLAALRLKGDKAFALFLGPGRQQYMMPMVREGGAWKVNQAAPIAYPIGAPASGG
jgi:hypothetical protein